MLHRAAMLIVSWLQCRTDKPCIKDDRLINQAQCKRIPTSFLSALLLDHEQLQEIIKEHAGVRSPTQSAKTNI